MIYIFNLQHINAYLCLLAKRIKLGIYDDNSCGVFCLSFLDSIIRGLSISDRITQAIVDKLRKDYAFEIFLNNIDPSEAMESE